MLRLVIDTNVFLEALSRTSPYHIIFQALLVGKFVLCLSNEILSEYEEVIGRVHRPQVRDAFLQFLLESPFTHFVSPTFRFNLITADADDNKFVDCAIAANADFIVTSDAHFNVLRDVGFPRVTVVSPQEFIERFLINR
jgi:putative PIN family toxin of toxin-antitoxin system